MAFQDDTWIYGTITLNQFQGNNAQNVKYAVEFDVDPDGNGDWLIIANKPASSDWVVEGVQVFKDSNKDVGGEQPMLTDNVPATGDGYETMIFDNGQGNDPDTAWVRISPNDSNTVEFAIKSTVLETPKKYLISMWAGTNLIDPTLFDLSDKFTHEQAGAADSGLNIFYLIREVSEIDNSCRMAVGFQPTGKEPGLCVVFIPINIPGVEPVFPPGSTCVQQSCDAEYKWNPATCTCDYAGPR